MNITVVDRKCYSGAVWCVEALPSYDPRRPAIAANAKANTGRRDIYSIFTSGVYRATSLDAAFPQEKTHLAAFPCAE